MSSSVKVVKDNWKDVAVLLDRNIATGVRNVAFGVETQLKAYITKPPGGPSPTAQANHKGGLVDTGNYRDSWTVDIGVDGNSAEIGSPVEYGVYLEYGTRNAPAYPHVVPAADFIRRQIVRFFQRLDRR